MNTLRNASVLWLLFLCGTLSIQAQEVKRFESMDDFSRANQPLVAYLASQDDFSNITRNGVQFVELNPKPDVTYAYTGDFNQDGQLDVLFNFVDEHTDNGDVQDLISSSLRLYYSSKQGYIKRSVQQLNTIPIFDLRLLDVAMDDGYLLLDIKDYQNQIYHRHVALRYHTDANRFMVMADGGEGVFFPGSPYQEVDASALQQEMLTFADLGNFDRYAPPMVDIHTLRYGKPHRTVRVKTYREFLEALDSNTEIILDMPELNLSDPAFKKELLNFTEADDLRHRRVSYTAPYQGNDKPYALILRGFTDLTIRGESMVEIISTVEDDEIIAFENCENIRIENLNFYHKVGVDPCSGGVSNFKACKNVEIVHCFFNGSGIIGLNIQWSENVRVTNSYVYNNSQHALVIHDSEDVVFEDCEFYGNELQDHFMVQIRSDVTIKQSNIHHNSSYAGFLSPLDEQSVLQLQDNRITENNLSMRESAVDAERYHLRTARLTEHNTQVSEEQRLAADYFQTDLKPDQQVIQALAALHMAENRRRMEDVLDSYSFPLEQYWEKTQVDRNQLMKIYEESWEDQYFSESTMGQIIHAGDNGYFEAVDYAYRLAGQPEKLVETPTVLRLVLDESGKIKSVQPEPDGRVKLRRMNLIVDWANAVNRMDVDGILPYFQFPLRHFESDSGGTESSVTEFYRDLWGKFSTTQLRIQRMEPLSADTYDVVVHYLFAGQYDPDGFHRDFRYKVVFEGEKIVALRAIPL